MGPTYNQKNEKTKGISSIRKGLLLLILSIKMRRNSISKMIRRY